MIVKLNPTSEHAQELCDRCGEFFVVLQVSQDMILVTSIDGEHTEAFTSKEATWEIQY